MEEQLAEFPLSEYRDRVERARLLMKSNGIDAIVLTGDTLQALNYRYLSGHVPRDFQMNLGRTHIMVLTQDGRAGLIVRNRSVETAKLTSWVKDIRSYNEPFHIEPLVEILRDYGLERARIGFELGKSQRMMMPVGDFMALQVEMSNAEFVDAGDLLWELRQIKSDAEVECIRKAGEINGAALDKVLSNLRVGMSEKDIITDVISEIVNNGAFRPPHAQWQGSVSTRSRSKDIATRILAPSNEPLSKGDIILVDTGAIYKGYWGEFGRMAVLGEPSEVQIETHRIAREVVQRIIKETIVPGITGREIIEQVLNIYEEYGVNKSQTRGLTEYPYASFGHSLGLCASEAPYLRIDNDKPLLPGMVFAVESSLVADCRYVSEDLVRVTEDGCELLTSPDTGLYINKV